MEFGLLTSAKHQTTKVHRQQTRYDFYEMLCVHLTTSVGKQVSEKVFQPK
eukprot:m.176456 g.176456  ORF g.176456 m.176456 type:complete len:50 (+) comp14627_c0_seq41:563-712(+)